MKTDGAADLIIPVDKPVGPTSHDVVAIARRALGTRRIGHTGTLDPFASGLLILCVGRATRLVEYLTGLPKGYHATARLDAFTGTDDATGEHVAANDVWRTLTRGSVEAALEAMLGEQQQVPPAYSAKKLEGRRAYEIARAGEVPALAPVTVRIDRIQLTRFDLPEIEFDVACSSGTYIRAIARDLGVRLGTGGYLSALRRTSIGAVSIDQAISLEELTDRERVDSAAIAPVDALPQFARVDVNDEEARRLRFGQTIPHPAPPGEVLIMHNRELLGIGFSNGSNLRPRKVLHSE